MDLYDKKYTLRNDIMRGFIDYRIHKYFGVDFNSFLKTTRYQKEIMYEIALETMEKENKEREQIENDLKDKGLMDE